MKANSHSKASPRTEEVRSIFEANYRTYQYRFVEFFIDHLSDLSRTFRGDLQAMIVLAILGQMYLRATSAAVDRGHDPRDIPTERLSITASRIADVTGIPRETVRRKLQELERKGWILRSDDGSWRLLVKDGKAPARDDLAEIDLRAMERVARLFRDLEGLVAAHATAVLGSAAAEIGAQIEQAPPRKEG